MTRSRLVFLLFAAALALPAIAAAKGPDEAKISGPGLGKTLTISGDGENMGNALGNFAMNAGFFPAAFHQTPNPMLPGRPKGALGPKYTITYRVPGPNRETYRITQDLYPYAHGGAVTYTKPGQKIFEGHTYGGWFPGGLPLKLTLQHQGLPAKAPSSGTNMALVAGIAVPGGIALAAAAAFATGYRRRQRPA
jgi:hypothetical protein